MTQPRRPRNIVVCCDGTSNQPANAQTNVAKLTYALVKDEDRQHVYYQPGLGTRAGPGFALPISSGLARLAGKAAGYGIKDDIRDAYVFIMNHWRPGDRLYLFGFSRGAYTVRALAALIHLYGVAMAGNEALIPYAIRMLWRASGADQRRHAEVMALAARFKASLAMAECRPHFVGVWDTVSSVGWVGTPVALPFTRTNPDLAHIRHAISLDEHRAFFRTNLFQPSAGQDCVQVWFPGDHCDVGGGYPEPQSGLSKYPLEWMATEARAQGLLLDNTQLATILGRSAAGAFVAATPTAPRHGNIPWYWWPAEFVPKTYWDRARERATVRINRFRRRTPAAAPLVADIAWSIPDYTGRPADARRYALQPSDGSQQ